MHLKTSSLPFKIAGVPEHFNYPWHMAIEQGYFANAGLQVEWEDYKTGTGAMTKALNAGEIDIAVLLTEGIIADIAKGGTSKIIQVFVKSPLIWGIHVSADSTIHHKFAIKGKRFAISRKGSGSHIMAYVLAKQMGYALAEEDFVIVNDMEGAKKALSQGEADVFLWEKYMTMPFIDSGFMKRIGEIPTPWPCFVIAAREDICVGREKDLKRLLDVIRTASGDFMTHPDAFELIAARYGLKNDRMYEWFQITEWETSGSMHGDILYTTAQTLHNAGIIQAVLTPDRYCADWCKVV